MWLRWWLHAAAPRRRLHWWLHVNPHLPHWLTDLMLRGLRVGQATVALGFWREAGTGEGERTRWETLDQQGDLTIEEQPWLPWHVEELAAQMA